MEALRKERDDTVAVRVLLKDRQAMLERARDEAVTKSRTVEKLSSESVRYRHDECSVCLCLCR